MATLGLLPRDRRPPARNGAARRAGFSDALRRGAGRRADGARASGRGVDHDPAQPATFAWAVAATLAAVTVVGWTAFSMVDTPPTAVAKAREASTVRAAQVKPPADLPADYLLAHQEYSPTMAIQGVGPYLRAVRGRPTSRRADRDRDCPLDDVFVVARNAPCRTQARGRFRCWPWRCAAPSTPRPRTPDSGSTAQRWRRRRSITRARSSISTAVTWRPRGSSISSMAARNSRSW